MLHAMADGAWVVGDAWLRDSLRAGRALAEAEYEPLAAARACRLAAERVGGAPPRALRGRRLFVAAAGGSAERAPALRALAEAAGATLLGAARGADLVLARCLPAARRNAGVRAAARADEGPIYVRDEWLFESVAACEPLPCAGFELCDARAV
mmetsp:Transcript_13179/g.42131  ORF Transcript_13179/g.42131 Transcript_13179/m.42131 type:complete len:153 (+) Transcript_13179:215-673(+)